VQQAIDLCNEYGLKHAKYTMREVKNDEELIMTTLQEIVKVIEEAKIK
jgi:hypothetical protein